MRYVAVLAIALGVLLLAAGVAIGVPFTGIYLLGFIGTGGREAGRELFMFLPVTLLAGGVGFGLLKVGQGLLRK